MTHMNFGQKLQSVIDSLGLSQTELGQAVGSPQSRVSEWCSGKSLPKYDKLVRIARFLGITTDYLLDDSIHDPSPNWSMDPADARKLTQAAEVIIRLVRVETSDHSAIAPPVVAGPVSDVPRRAGKQNTG